MTTPRDDARCDAPSGECHLCGDVATVGWVLQIDADARTATVALADGPVVVALDLVDAGVGDEVLVHLGFAIERVEAAERVPWIGRAQ